MEVCVITGGGSGMGLEAAGQMDKDKILILAGVDVLCDGGAISRRKYGAGGC